MTFTYEYPRPAVTVDCVVFGIGDAEREAGSRAAGASSSSAGLIPSRAAWRCRAASSNVSDDGDQGEDLDAAALPRAGGGDARQGRGYLEQLYTWGARAGPPRPGHLGRVLRARAVRRPRGRRRVDDAKDGAWTRCAARRRRERARPGLRPRRDAARRRTSGCARRCATRPSASTCCRRKFTLTELQRLYEADPRCASSTSATSASASWRWTSWSRRGARRTCRTARRASTASTSARTTGPSRDGFNFEL